MFLSIDLGGSTVDVILFDKKILKIISLESEEVDKSNLRQILDMGNIELKQISTIVLTGGRNRKFSHKLGSIPIIKVDEIEAIGAGGKALTNLKDALVISMGTGTCMVSMKNNQFRHIGGTGLGGGTLVGLGQLILKERNSLRIQELALKGDLKTVDLSVKDIVGEGIGIIPGFATAANFGKLNNFKNEDLALGICNLIGQTIASTANFAANTYQHQHIILTGKLVRIEKIVQIIKNTARLYNREIIVPKNGEYVSAIGAMTCFLNKFA